MAKKLSSKANYVSKRNIKSITVQRGKKTTEIASKDLIDGAYVKKSVKFKKGGMMEKNYVVVCKNTKTGEEQEFEVSAEDKQEAKEIALGMCEFSNPKVTSVELYGKGGNTNELKAKKRLEELRKELRAERISYSELLELQSLAKYIDKNDVELLEAAGVDEFRTGGVAGSKHVDVTKGYRLPHGYKAVKGEDRNRNYSKGKPKVKVTPGWRLPKGYEVVDGAYNMKYEDGGMMAEKRVRIIKDVNFDGYFKIVDASSNRIVLEDNIRGVKNAITTAEDEGYDIVSVPRGYDEDEYAKGGNTSSFEYSIGGL